MTLPGYVAWRTVSPTPSEYWRDGLQALIDQGFENASNVFTIQKLNTSTNLYENITVRLDTPYDIKQNTTFEDDFRKIIFKDNTKLPLVGDSYYFNDFYWICIDKSNVNSPTTSCIVQKCKHSISLYKSGILSQVSCIVLDRSNSNDTQLRVNLNKYILTIDCDAAIVVSSNARNLLIEAGDVFQLGKYNYEVIKPDNLSKYGLILLPLKFTENQNTNTFTITIQNSNTILEVDDTCTLNVICTNNGLTVTTPTVTYTSSNTDIATVSSSGVVTAISGGTAIITATFNSTTDTINVTVQEIVVDDYSVVVSGDSNIVLNNNLTLTASVYNNGVIDSSKSVVWSFSNQDLSSNVYVTLISSTTSSITFKATNNSSYVGEYVVVRATKSDDASVYGEKVIRVKSLF